MRYTIFLLAFLAFSFSAFSEKRQIKAVQIETIELPDNIRVKSYKLNSSGNLIVFSTLGTNDLKAYDITTKKLFGLPSGASLNTTVLSSDDNQLFYTETVINVGQKEKQLIAFSLSTGKSRVITEETIEQAKRWNWWYRLWNKEKRKLAETDFVALKNGALSVPYIYLKEGQLVYNGGESEKILNPLEAKYYLHPSLSPDKTKICGFAVGKGAFVCDTDGGNVVKLGNMEAPAWVNNKLVAGMITSDDGHNINSSEIKIIDIETLESKLVLPAEHKGMYPTAIPDKNQIICTTPEGQLILVEYITEDL
ncbi:MAG: hypothetical protein ABFS16_00805 [Bacteroidota bacterium]